MPCQESERDANARRDDLPCTPTKSTGNDGPGSDDQNGSTNSQKSFDSDFPVAKQKRKRPNAKYVYLNGGSLDRNKSRKMKTLTMSCFDWHVILCPRRS